MNTWTKEEFEIYSLLYAASVDLQISEQELSLIAAEIQPNTFKKMYEEFQKGNDAERINNIINRKDQFLKTEEEKADLLKEIKNLFFSDGKFSTIEAGVLNILKRIL